VGEWTPLEIITPQDRNSRGYDCGVYLCFYIREILESGRLELKRSYTENERQRFRKEWKARIGESWGRWD
jgi:Ulp1 family protease